MFGFPKIDRENKSSFKKNYLKSIIFQIRYDENENLIKNKASIVEIYKNNFPRFQDSISQGFEISISQNQTPILQPIVEKDTAFELRSTDGQKVISFTKDTATYTIAGRSYSTFENVISELELIQNTLRDNGVSSINRLAIRKVNVLDFEIPEGDVVSPMQIMGMVLNENLISNIDYFPGRDFILQNIHNLVYKKNEEFLNLRYGFVVQANDSRNGQIIIDVDRFSTEEKKLDSLISEFTNINNEIFNIFIWSFNEETIKQLKA